MKFRVIKTYAVENIEDTEHKYLTSACFSAALYEVKIFKEPDRYHAAASCEWTNIAEVWGTSYVEVLKNLLSCLKNSKKNEKYLEEVIALVEQVIEYMLALETEEVTA